MSGQNFMDAAFSHLGQVLESLHEDDRHEKSDEPECVHTDCIDCGVFREVNAQDRCAECAEGVG